MVVLVQLLRLGIIRRDPKNLYSPFIDTLGPYFHVILLNPGSCDWCGSVTKAAMGMSSSTNRRWRPLHSLNFRKFFSSCFVFLTVALTHRRMALWMSEDGTWIRDMSRSSRDGLRGDDVRLISSTPPMTNFNNIIWDHFDVCVGVSRTITTPLSLP